MPRRSTPGLASDPLIVLNVLFAIASTVAWALAIAHALGL
jgi:hypothetical protein